MIKKALILAAGKGMRMLPITNGSSKELLRINSKPLIDYAIEEAIEAGCREIGIVINKSKIDLYEYLAKKNLEGITIRIIFREPNGLIDAIKSAKNFINGQPFALILPDMLSIGKPNALQKIIKLFNDLKKPIIGLIKETEFIGGGYYAEISHLKEDAYLITDISGLNNKIRFFGRYVMPAKTFDYLEILKNEESEINLLKKFITTEGLYGILLEKNIFDAGIPESYRKLSISNFDSSD